MNPESYLSFIHTQLQPPDRPFALATPTVPKRAVTISRQSGCGAHIIAGQLAKLLQSITPPDAPAWEVFDRNLVDVVLADHQLPSRLAQYMPEDRVPELSNIVDEIAGLHPSSWTLLEQTAETIRRLADRGNVILIGRGAQILTACVPHMFHIRIVGSLERRMENLQRTEGLEPKEAAERIRREDLGRERYLAKHFGKKVDDSLLYHLIINTDRVSPDKATRLIGELMLGRSVVSSQ
jgi:cytidylate kinase